jgi:hypothetical protein
MKIPICIVFLILSLGTWAQNDTTPKQYPHYQIKVSLSPEKGTLEVNGRLVLPKWNYADTACWFLLNEGLDVLHFSCNGDPQFLIDTNNIHNPATPNALRISWQHEPMQNNREIHFAYQGKFSQLPPSYANRFQEDWVEMGLYYPWFPYNPNIPLFTYQIKVQIDSEYQVFGMGDIAFKNDRWILTSNEPTNDIVVCAAKQMDEALFTTWKIPMMLYHQGLHDTVLSSMRMDFGAIMALYNSWFGASDRGITVVLSKRKYGGGYSRIGGVFLGGFDPAQFMQYREGYQRYFAHEFAHLWWFQAPVDSWEDWLNEGFAEYCALMTIRAAYGEEAFQKRLQRKTNGLDTIPPVWGFDRNNKATEADAQIIQRVLYHKSPVLLYKLENRIGKKAYLQCSREFLKQPIHDTHTFLAVLQDQEGAEVTEWFEELLKTY